MWTNRVFRITPKNEGCCCCFHEFSTLCSTVFTASGIWNFCITTVQLIIFFPLSFHLFFYRTEKKCRNGSSLPPPQVFPRLSERRKRETTKQQAREEDDVNDRRARVGSDERWAFSSLPITSFVRAFLHNREFKQRRFGATHIYRKWTFCTLELQFSTNFWANCLLKSKGT